MKRLVAAIGIMMAAGCADDPRGPVSTTGCGDGVVDPLKETCDDGNLTSGDGCSSACEIEETIAAHWTVANSAGEPQPCPAGFDTVDVLAQSLQVAITEATFPCADGEGTFDMLEEPRTRTNGFLLELRRSDTHELFSQTRSGDVPTGPTLGHPFDVRFQVIINEDGVR